MQIKQTFKRIPSAIVVAPIGTVSLAHQQGYADHFRGVTKNPYQYRTDGYQDWVAGQCAAAFDDPKLKGE